MRLIADSSLVCKRCNIEGLCHFIGEAASVDRELTSSRADGELSCSNLQLTSAPPS